MPIRPENRGRYPADWRVRSRFVRFVRARGRCEWCGAVHGQPHPITGSTVVLTTAHVHDDRPEAASLLNLAALCQRCHNAHDAARRQARRRERARREAGQGTLWPVVEPSTLPQDARFVSTPTIGIAPGRRASWGRPGTPCRETL